MQFSNQNAGSPTATGRKTVQSKLEGTGGFKVVVDRNPDTP